MCKSQAEGGQRCSAHARTRYQRANAALAATPNSDQAWQDFIQAEIEYASTPEGAQVLSDRLADLEAAKTRTDVMDALRGTIQRGQDLRTRNAAVAKAGKATQTPEPAPAVLSRVRQDIQDRFAALREPRDVSPPVPSLPSLRAQYQAEMKKGFVGFTPDREAEIDAKADERARLRIASATAHEAAMLRGHFTAEDKALVFEDAWENSQDLNAHPHGLGREYAQWRKSEQAKDDAVRAHRGVMIDRARQTLAEHTPDLDDTARANLDRHISFLAHPTDSATQRERAIRDYGPAVVSAIYASPTLTSEQKAKWSREIVRDLSGEDVNITPPSLLRRTPQVWPQGSRKGSGRGDLMFT